MSDAWIPVIGTLAGALLGFLSSYVIERSRRRYERSRRFEGERRAAIVRLIEAADQIERWIRDRNIELWARAKYPERVVEVRPAPDFSKVDLAVAEIAILSRFSLEVAASLYRMNLQTLDSASHEQDDEAEKAWSDASSGVIHARTQFIRAAKRDLDLPTGVMGRWQNRVWKLRKRLGLTPRAKSTPKRT